MIEESVLLEFYKIYPPAEESRIEKVEQELGMKLPKAYKELLRHTNGFLTDDGINIFGTDDIVERNMTYEVKEYAPGYLGVGSDGGDYFFIMVANDEEKEMMKVDSGSMNPKYANIYASDFLVWVNEGAKDYELESWRKEQEEELHRELCNIVLVKPPKGGAKDLKKIQEVFRIKTSLFDLLKNSKRLPFVILKDSPLEEAKKSAGNLGELSEIIEIIPVGSIFDRDKN